MRPNLLPQLLLKGTIFRHITEERCEDKTGDIDVGEQDLDESL